MSVRMRHTRGHTNNRRSHHALAMVKTVRDQKSGKLRLAHRLDESTGEYRGKQIFEVKVKGTNETKKKITKPEPTGEHGHDHTHEHANAEVKSSKGFLGRIGIARPKARSGMGGQAGS